MHWLGALVAFAATMLIFAIFVSTFVELIHRAFGLRAKGLHMMLETFFIDVLEDKFQLVEYREAEATDTALTAKATRLRHAGEFADEVMRNPVVPMSSSNSKGGAISGFLDKFLRASVVTEVPVEVFTERLVESSFVNDLDKLTDDVLLDIAQKYELFGARASEYFERRARLLSVLVALVIAAVFYVNPYSIMLHYLQSPDSADAVVAQATSNYAVAPVSVTIDVGDGEASLQSLLDELDDRVEEITGEVEKLGAGGAAVGWPAMHDQSACNQAWFFSADICRKKFLFIDNMPRPGLIHLVWIMLGGLLIGLGAPFWARVLSNLSATRDITRSLAKVVGHSVEPQQRARHAGFQTEGLPGHSGSPAESTGSAGPVPLALATFRAAKRVRM